MTCALVTEGSAAAPMTVTEYFMLDKEETALRYDRMVLGVSNVRKHNTNDRIRKPTAVSAINEAN